MSVTRAGCGFERFYDDHASWALQLAWLLVRDAAVAEDVAHDAFVAVFARFDRLEDPRAYLRATLVNEVRQRARRLHRERNRHRVVAEREAVEADPADLELMEAIDVLPVQQRTAVVLRYWADLSVDEIASTMNTKPGTVKSWLSRARAQLRGALS